MNIIYLKTQAVRQINVIGKILNWKINFTSEKYPTIIQASFKEYFGMKLDSKKNFILASQDESNYRTDGKT